MRQPAPCGSIFGHQLRRDSRNLIESTLFGHERGSFTGADRAAKGYFRDADGGTLLLDEIGELPLGLQSKLLRVLEEGAVTPVGTTAPSKVDVRIVAATNRDLEQQAGTGEFRQDLFFSIEHCAHRFAAAAGSQR